VQYSPTAGAYYWKLWFGPGFDFDHPGSVAEVARIEKFWLDTGTTDSVGRRALDARFKVTRSISRRRRRPMTNG